MIIFTEYRPTFVESEEPLIRIEVASMRELLDHPYIAELIEEPYFDKFIIQDSSFMIVTNKDEWYVLGKLQGHSASDMEEWDFNPPKFNKRKPVKWEQII